MNMSPANAACMAVYRSLHEVGAELALAIGNFDGVHRGHQAILQATVEASARGGLTPAALTFHPLPREFFAKVRGDASLAPARLMSTTEKLAVFSRAGIRHTFMPIFDTRFAAQTPEDFIAKLVAMKVRWLMVGEDFRFGAKRAGDIAALRAAGAAAGTGDGFSVHTMADIVDAENDSAVRVSSTAVREALAAGKMTAAARMLGRRYTIVGRVTHGKKLGRTLGFPTANISLTRRKPALAGVFAVKLRLVTRGLEGVASRVGDTLFGVANLGTNPAVVNDGRHHLEVFLFDYSGDLYGKRVEVEFFEKVRDEQNFSSLDALVVQMHADCAEAKRILRGT